MGWILEQHLVRPSLRVPSASVVVGRLAAASGYKIQPSQAGRLNELVIEMWGGLEAAAGDLSGPTWCLLEALTPTLGDGNGPRDVSLVVNRIPYVTVDHAKVLLGLDEQSTRAEIDRLLRLGVLRRGLILRCARCNWLDWYSVADLGRCFGCHRCDHENFLEQARWRDPVLEPRWYYDLDHAVREALANNGRVPILALEWLRTKQRASFSFTTDLELVKTGGTLHPPEIDFVVVGDGRLIVGEAKKSNRLAPDRRGERRKLARLCEVARDLTSDDICLATTANAWDRGTLALADEALGDLRVGRLYAAGLGAE